jgi:cyclomaltodextrinase
MPLLSVAALVCSAMPLNSFVAREQDWRVGPVVYQIFVDRFAPPHDRNAKRAIVRPPRVLKNWSDLPQPGKLVKSLGLYSHELEFWGGDLESTRSRLDYVSKLGADVVYLNPIHKALTNHKYDAEDFNQIDPMYGTDGQFQDLVRDVHARKMKLMLDGVFNHIGRNSLLFQEASSSPASQYRNWFYFDPKYQGGYRAWAGVGNLAALNLENPEVRSYLWSGGNSVVRKFLDEGADGWRLDVAFELGPSVVGEITAAAHRDKPGSDVVGEISGYPSEWFPSVDGVFNFFSMSLVEQTLNGSESGGRAGLALNHLVLDAGIEHLLRSWLLVDNHDTPRFASAVPDLSTRKLIWAMQMCLPGSPVIYYGTELGMEGAGDPQNRAPMRWDLAKDTNENLTWVAKLIRLRRASPALRYGDFLAMDTNKLLAFVRTTDKVLDTRLVVLNPTDQPIVESFPLRVGRLMSWGSLTDQLSGEKIRSVNGMVSMTLPPKTVRIYAADSDSANGYSPYHRIP